MKLIQDAFFIKNMKTKIDFVTEKEQTSPMMWYSFLSHLKLCARQNRSLQDFLVTWKCNFHFLNTYLKTRNFIWFFLNFSSHKHVFDLNKKLCVWQEEKEFRIPADRNGTDGKLLPDEIVLLPKAAGCGYVLLVMSFYWLLEAVPMAITALLPVVCFPLLGILSSNDVCATYMKVSSFV